MKVECSVRSFLLVLWVLALVPGAVRASELVIVPPDPDAPPPDYEQRERFAVPPDLDDAQPTGYDEIEIAWRGDFDWLLTSPETVNLDRGLVVRMDPDGPRVEIDGALFSFAPDARVQLLAGYGAPTLLAPGMAVEYFWVAPKHEGTVGEILTVSELEDASPYLD